MPIENDTPTLEGATNVALHQRAATPPFAREVVNIQGDANPGRAIGFSATGVLTALQIDESPFAIVDTEAQFDAALAAGRSIKLRGEGSGGIVSLTAPKLITTARTVIEGPGHIQFAGLVFDAFCLQLQAPDLILRDFEMSSTFALASSNQSGIYFTAVLGDEVQHRTKLQRLELHNWFRCVTKYGGHTNPYTEDVLIEDCYLHTFRWGLYLTFCLRRLTVRRCVVLGKLTSDTHTADGNAAKIDDNIEDLLVEDCVFGHCDLMGIEMTTDVGGHQLRPRLSRVLITNVGNYGVSFGHCTQGYAEGVVVDGAVGVGFEVAGNDVTGRANATLVACDVRNVNNPAGQCFAYTVDKADDTVLSLCRAMNITAVPTNAAGGIYVYMSERAVINNCGFMNAGGAAIHLYRGTGVNTTGFHVIQGCTFRDTVNLPTSRNAVFVNDTNTIVRNNTAFQRPTGAMPFVAACTAGAAVYCDTGAPVITGEFTGSNLVVPCPA